jgi:hypothetical protein
MSNTIILYRPDYNKLLLSHFASFAFAIPEMEASQTTLQREVAVTSKPAEITSSFLSNLVPNFYKSALRDPDNPLAYRKVFTQSGLSVVYLEDANIDPLLVLCNGVYTAPLHFPIASKALTTILTHNYESITRFLFAGGDIEHTAPLIEGDVTVYVG